MEDNKFTNKEELEYPTEDDFVDVKVLNNNTRLLSEQKADIDDIEVSLQGVAKERTEYSIEDKVKSLEQKILNIEEYIPKLYYNLRGNRGNVGGSSKPFNIDRKNLIFSITGSGELLHSLVWINHFADKGNLNFKTELIVDGKTVSLNNFKNIPSSLYSSKSYYFYGYFSRANITRGYITSKYYYPESRSIMRGSSDNFVSPVPVVFAFNDYGIFGISEKENQISSYGAYDTNLHEFNEGCNITGTVSDLPIKFKKSVEFYITPLGSNMTNVSFEMSYCYKLNEV